MTADYPPDSNSNFAPGHDEIARCARERWTEAGGPEGRDAEFWLEAECLLRSARQKSGVSVEILATPCHPATLPKITMASTPSPRELRVVLAYGNISAACRATECLQVKRRTDSDEQTMSLSPWSFSSLESPAFFSLAASSVRHANILAIAACEPKRPLSAVIERWLRMCLSRRHKTQLTVMAILGSDDRAPGTETPWVESVQRLAISAGCAFLPWVAIGTLDSMP
ncbi:MAG: DUF2934 domain-containing protein [Lacunisphaera sp.]